MSIRGKNYAGFEDKFLVAMHRAGVNYAEIATRMDRSPVSLRKRVHELRRTGQYEVIAYHLNQMATQWRAI